MQESVYLGIGSNVGDRACNIQNCISYLNRLEGFQIDTMSALYESSPMYFTDQAYFLNQVIMGKTSDSPVVLLDKIKRIETGLKRNFKVIRNGPRIIDIDILSYEKSTISSNCLTVPHKRLSERKFVLQPWSEIAPDFYPPGSQLSILQMLHQLHDYSVVYTYIHPEKVLT